MRNAFKIAVVALAALTSRAALAASTFTVSATVQKVCNVNTTDVNFGNYDATSTSDVVMPVANVSLSCTKATPATVKLTSASAVAGGGFAMKGPGTGASATEALTYHLYQDTAHATEWSAATPATLQRTSTGLSAPMLYPVYAVLPKSQDVSVGAYTDTVTVVVTIN